VSDPSSAVDDFIAIHQARWGEEGLFPHTEGGERSRRFFRRLGELEGPDGLLRIGRLRVDGRAIFMCVGFHDGDTVYYYNAGNDPHAQALSPGVVGVAYYLRHGLAEGTRVFDFLRGDEGYKYRWGAVDEPIHRLIVTRRTG
jgi:CelD/BcsL family acetyltransferase involved in cellulose biosynthesis